MVNIHRIFMPAPYRGVLSLKDRRGGPHMKTTRKRRQAPAAAPDLANLKAGGFIKQRQKDLFTVRVKTPVGALTVEKLRVIAEAAERFGSGEIHLFRRILKRCVLYTPPSTYSQLIAA